MLGAKKNSWLQLLLPNGFAYSCGNSDDYVDNYDYGYGISCLKGLLVVDGKEKQLVTDSYYFPTGWLTRVRTLIML